MQTATSTNSGSPFAGTMAIVLMVIGVLWALSASWLTANEWITTYTEFNTYFWSGCLVAVGGLVCITLRSGRNPRLKGAIFEMALGLVIIWASCRYSDDTFIFWKVRVVKPAEWQKMVSDLRTLDQKGRESNTRFEITKEKDGLFNPTREKIALVSPPKSFDPLGLLSDFRGGHAGIDSGNPTVVYGVKSRRWGLVIGSSDFSHGEWSFFKRVQVGDNAWFFAGPDG
jgi:hypothetical protein